MVQVRSLSDSADKLERRGSSAGPDYEAGVEASSDSEWENNTLDQEDTWGQAVQEAAAEGRFGNGVRNPNKSWQQASLETGSGRFTQGMSNAGQAWQQGFDSFADTLESLDLQPRGPRGSSENQQRSIRVQEALHNARE